MMADCSHSGLLPLALAHLRTIAAAVGGIHPKVGQLAYFEMDTSFYCVIRNFLRTLIVDESALLVN
jgi:hypothetical protein